MMKLEDVFAFNVQAVREEVIVDTGCFGKYGAPVDLCAATLALNALNVIETLQNTIKEQIEEIATLRKTIGDQIFNISALNKAYEDLENDYHKRVGNLKAEVENLCYIIARKDEAYDSLEACMAYNQDEPDCKEIILKDLAKVDGFVSISKLRVECLELGIAVEEFSKTININFLLNHIIV